MTRPPGTANQGAHQTKEEADAPSAMRMNWVWQKKKRLLGVLIPHRNANPRGMKTLINQAYWLELDDYV